MCLIFFKPKLYLYMLKSDPILITFSGKLGRINLDADLTKASREHAPYLSEKSRSYSTGKMHHVQNVAEVNKQPRVTFRHSPTIRLMLEDTLTVVPN